MQNPIFSHPLVCLADEKFNHPAELKLQSHWPQLNHFFNGGLPFGNLCEFGIPLGREGRHILLLFLAASQNNAHSQDNWLLWINAFKDVVFYPPAWIAAGLSPRYTVFCQTTTPVKHLNPVFRRPFFKVIVIDGATSLSMAELSFLNSHARENKILLLLIRPYFLSNKNGNVWAKMRVNISRRQPNGAYLLVNIRGLNRPRFFFSESPAEKGLSGYQEKNEAP